MVFDIEILTIAAPFGSIAVGALRFSPNPDIVEGCRTEGKQEIQRERMKGARRDVRICWKKYRRRLEREKGAITSLQNALFDFFLEDYSPRIGDRLNDLAEPTFREPEHETHEKARILRFHARYRSHSFSPRNRHRLPDVDTR